MRKPYGWTVMLALGAVAFSYACSDDATTDPGADDDDDSGVDASKPRDAEPPPRDGGDAASPPRDGGDAGDAGDAAIEAGPPKVMVVRAGTLDGGTLGRLAAAVFVDEYELATNTVVRSIALPAEPSGTQQRLVQSAPSIQIEEGEIARSADGHSVAITGYTNYHTTTDAPPFVVFGPDISSAPRVVARVQADGKVDTTTLISDSFAPTNIGGAVISGTDVWIGGTTAGPVGPVQYLHFANSLDGGATGGFDVIPPGAPVRALRIFDGQLYASTYDGKITRVGTGLPKTAGQSVTTVVEGLRGAFEFELVDMDGAAGAERLYVAVDGAGADEGVEGGVRKYVYDPGPKTWSLAATFKSGLVKGVRGLAAYKSGADVIVLTTTTEGDKILRFVDDGTASPPSTIVASAPAGVSLRGVTLSPTP